MTIHQLQCQLLRITTVVLRPFLQVLQEWQNAGEITVTIKNAGQKKSWAEGTAPDVTHTAGENSWLKIMARTEPGRELGRSEESLEVETGNY
jgi:hypothetical protein